MKNMPIIKLDGTQDTPYVDLDANKEVLNMSGRSLPEDVWEFYEPILNWFDNYAELDKNRTVVEFKFDYFSTASSRIFLDILRKLEDMKHKGKEVKVRWFYPDDDEDMFEAGELYSEIVDVPFEKISYSIK